MKQLIFFCFIFFTKLILSQELVLNGDFEDGNYLGGSDPINFYSAIQNGVYSLPDRFDAGVSEWYTIIPPKFKTAD